MERACLWLGVAWSALFCSVASAQTTLRFQGGAEPSPAYRGAADTFVKEQSPTLNLGQLPQLRVTTSDIGGGRAWSLLRWDLSGHVPPGVVLSQARLRLYVSPDDPGAACQVYALLRDWSEGDGSVGSGASWTTSDGSSPWQSPGAQGASDRGASAIATLPGGAGFQEITLGAAGLALVQQWVDDPTSNHGLLIQNQSSDAVDFASREDPDPSLRPRLELTFDLPSFGSAGPSTSVSLRQGLNGYGGATDTTLYQPSANSNYGGLNLALTAPSYSWSLFRWDLSSLPAGATVTDASLEFTYVNAAGASYELHRLLRSWNEGQATWNLRSAGTAWGSAGANQAGGDYDPSALGSIPAGPQNSRQTLTLGAAGRAVIQGWLDTPSSNFGFVVRGSGSSYAYYASSENSSAARRPQLNLTYQVGTAGTTRTALAPGRWSDAGTWTPPGVPGASERAVLSAPVTLDDGGSHTVTRLDVRAGGELIVSNGSLSASDLVGLLPGGRVRLTGGVLRALGTTLVLPGAALELSGGELRLGGAPCWLGAEAELSATGGTLAADSPATPMRVDVHARASLSGLTVRHPDSAGLRFTRYAELRRLRGCRFEGVASGAGSCLLSLEQERLQLNAPGNYFDAVAADQAAVRIRDLDPSPSDDVALNLEWRDAATNGPGARSEQELDGAAVNWVHAAPDTTAGVGVGFPQVAYDLNTFAYYATYAAFRDADASGTDRIQVFDPDGAGQDQGFWFEVPASHGDLSGGYWWDQRGSARVVWALTTTGWVFRFTNPGSGSGAIPPDAGFPLRISDPTPVSFTTSPLTADQSLVFAAGTVAGQPRFFALDAGSGALAWSLAAGLGDPITSKLGSETQGGLTVVYAGGGQVLDQSTLLLSESFNAGPGAFAYRDDAFRGTSSPSDAAGDYSATGGRSGGRVRVRLGNFGANMSGGWAVNFVVPGSTPALVEVRFAYRLVSGDRFENDEFQQVLAAIDGALLGVAPQDYVLQFVGDGNGGPSMDSGWAQAAFRRTLAPGSHELVLGGFANKSTEDPEIAEVYLDDVSLETIATQGRLYRFNSQTRLVEREQLTSGPISGSVVPASGSGLFAADENGAVHALDHATLQPLPGWPVQTGTPLRSDVWFDWFEQLVFFGGESGALFAYDLDGAPLSGWPLPAPFGAPDPIRTSPLYDRGVLWAGSSRGRVVALDVSTASLISPDYRFGGVELSRISQEAQARIMVTTSAGQLLVLDAQADPTP